jgi:hypothetical protein
VSDIHRIIADPFDVRGHPQCRQDDPQVAGQRAAADQPDHVVVDLLLQRVDRLVVADHALRGLVVAAFDHVQRGVQLRHRHLAHADQFVEQGVLFFVVALDDVVALLVHQPNLPVM